jgi:hypothetical protein
LWQTAANLEVMYYAMQKENKGKNMRF